MTVEEQIAADFREFCDWGLPLRLRIVLATEPAAVEIFRAGWVSGRLRGSEDCLKAVKGENP